MIVRLLRWSGRTPALVCDAKCHKAWGINHRPTRRLGEDEDDVEYLADSELGDAPEDPGTYEGGQAKPAYTSERLNKWCARECERSVIVDLEDGVVELHDFSKPLVNMPHLHAATGCSG